MHSCIHAFMHPCIHASMHPCIHVSMHPSMHPCIHHTHTHTHTRTHARMHKHKHTHTHTCARSNNLGITFRGASKEELLVFIAYQIQFKLLYWSKVVNGLQYLRRLPVIYFSEDDVVSYWNTVSSVTCCQRSFCCRTVEADRRILDILNEQDDDRGTLIREVSKEV